MRRAVDVAVETRRRRNFSRAVRVDGPRAVDHATSRRGDVSDVFEFVPWTAAIWRTGVHYGVGLSLQGGEELAATSGRVDY